MTTTQTPPDWRQDLIDFAKVVYATGVPKAQQANHAVRGVASSAHGTAGAFVRWFIVFVALLPIVFAGFALPSPEFARAVVPGITIAMLVVTVLLFAFRWNQLVAGLVELGIITTLVSKVKKPQALGSLAGAVKDLGTATLRWTSKVIGLELLIGIYFSLVPVANERVLILVVLMLMAATVSLSLGKVKKLTWIPIVLLYMVTVVFFNGGIDESIRKYEERQANAQTTSVTGQLDESQLFYEFTLLGETEKAGPFDITRLVPPGWDARWRGPESAQVHWSDGSSGKLTEMWGVKGGRVWFTGPAGDVVLMRIIPPSPD